MAEVSSGKHALGRVRDLSGGDRPARQQGRVSPCGLTASRSELTPTDIAEREDDDDDLRRPRRPPVGVADDEELPEFEWTKERSTRSPPAPAEDELAERAVESADGRGRPRDDEDEEDEDRAPPTRRCPSSCPTREACCCSCSAEGLVDFVKSGAPHDLTQLEGWTKFARRSSRRRRRRRGRHLRAGPGGGEPARRPRRLGCRAGAPRRRAGSGSWLRASAAEGHRGARARLPARRSRRGAARIERGFLCEAQVAKNRVRAGIDRLAKRNWQNLFGCGLARLSLNRGASIFGTTRESGVAHGPERRTSPWRSCGCIAVSHRPSTQVTSACSGSG